FVLGIGSTAHDVVMQVAITQMAKNHMLDIGHQGLYLGIGLLDKSGKTGYWNGNIMLDTRAHSALSQRNTFTQMPKRRTLGATFGNDSISHHPLFKGIAQYGLEAFAGMGFAFTI